MPSVALHAVCQVMKLRRRYDELSEEVGRLTQQRELLLTQMNDDQADWEKRQQVRRQRQCVCTSATGMWRPPVPLLLQLHTHCVLGGWDVVRLSAA